MKRLLPLSILFFLIGIQLVFFPWECHWSVLERPWPLPPGVGAPFRGWVATSQGEETFPCVVGQTLFRHHLILIYKCRLPGDRNLLCLCPAWVPGPWNPHRAKHKVCWSLGALRWVQCSLLEAPTGGWLLLWLHSCLWVCLIGEAGGIPEHSPWALAFFHLGTRVDMDTSDSQPQWMKTSLEYLALRSQLLILMPILNAGLNWVILRFPSTSIWVSRNMQIPQLYIPRTPLQPTFSQCSIIS